MAALSERPEMLLRGLKRRRKIVGAVLVLHGARRASLQSASALVATLADQCILVAVDGGLRTCLAAHRRPDLYVGDGDSARRVPTEIPSVVYPRDKPFSDLAGALGEVRDRKVQVVVAAGLLGGRLDHEWANVLELANWSRSFAALLAPTDRGTVLVTRHGCQAATVRQRTFSLFALGGMARVSLRGSRWELDRRQLRPGSLGLSNLTGTELDLTVHSGVAALVFLPPAKRSRAKLRTATP